MFSFSYITVFFYSCKIIFLHCQCPDRLSPHQLFSAAELIPYQVFLHSIFQVCSAPLVGKKVWFLGQWEHDLLCVAQVLSNKIPHSCISLETSDFLYLYRRFPVVVLHAALSLRTICKMIWESISSSFHSRLKKTDGF